MEELVICISNGEIRISGALISKNMYNKALRYAVFGSIKKPCITKLCRAKPCSAKPRFVRLHLCTKGIFFRKQSNFKALVQNARPTSVFGTNSKPMVGQ
jgi:hypothetical protein